MSNFSFLTFKKEYALFAPAAIEAEKVYHSAPAMCAIGSRKALELAVKWVYAADSSMDMPYRDNLQSLIHEPSFRFALDYKTWGKLPYIIKLGNLAVHTEKTVSASDALLSLRGLFEFIEWIDYCYGSDYEERHFDEAAIPKEKVIIDTAKIKEQESLLGEKEAEIERLRLKIEEMAAEYTVAKEENKAERTFSAEDDTEFKTRKKYIDVDLKSLGWKFEGEDADVWEEYEVDDMKGIPGQLGYADYVLFGKDGLPLAVIEAKRASRDANAGWKQVVLYADCLERKFGRRPIMFTTNGFDTFLWDDETSPKRMVSSLFGKNDLQKFINRREERKRLEEIAIDDRITDRYYQKEAIRAVCDHIEQGFRKHLLVMATGTGKTRTAASLTDVLSRGGYVTNVLFLADRNSLVLQAKRNFVNLMPDLSVVNLCEDKENCDARCVFSTYQTMFNCIDTIHDEQGEKLFTSGHFDLLICDEAHRSIYNKYRDIFNYFDAPLVGLTATPKDDIDKNTYDIFDLEKGVPTYGYELAQAVKDGYLVDFISVETTLKFIQQGIVYDDLSDEDKEAYENTFEDENGDLPESIESSALNEWIFNEDTIREVLRILMENGLKIDYGNKIGKTIIFAKNHTHAEKVLEVFGKSYPNLTNYAKVIDNYMTYAQSAIDEFSESNKLPQIAISVDMLDTGIDVPEVLNLVFFKKVMSKAKFWQMIGRGTRLCPGLMDGEDKSKFYIFDFCGNFEFFRMNKGRPTTNTMALAGALFFLKAQIAYKLQDLAYQTEPLMTFRETLVQDMLEKDQALDRQHFAVRQHLKAVEQYGDPVNYEALTYENTLDIKDELAPLIEPEQDDPKALRFDALLYGIELAYLMGEKYSRARHDLMNKVSAIASVANIPEIMAQSDLINKILHTDYLDNAGINEFEHIRESLRDLIKYIPVEKIIYQTNFDDEVLAMDWKQSELESDDLKNYKAKAEFYVRQHQDQEVIAKLKSNIPLTEQDVAELERILWSEIGSKQDYEREIGSVPLGEFVRGIVGLDMNAAKTAFAEYLDNTQLDSRQIYFVNQIVEYIVHNGMLKDFSVLQDPPFTDQGSIVDVFDMEMWAGIKKTIEQINANALGA